MAQNAAMMKFEDEDDDKKSLGWLEKGMFYLLLSVLFGASVIPLIGLLSVITYIQDTFIGTLFWIICGHLLIAVLIPMIIMVAILANKIIALGDSRRSA